MSRKKAFFISFLVSMAGVLTVYRLVWGAIQGRSSETDTPQTGVPKVAPGVHDSKTLLLGLGDSENPYFFLIKMSAINNRIGIGCVSPSFEFSDGDSMADSMRQAGMMQCLLDMEKELGINIDYYLQCSWRQAAALAEDMDEINIDGIGRDMPPVIRDFVLKGAEKISGESLVNCARKAAGFLDNEIGLAFLTESMAQLIMANPHRLEGVTDAIKENYSALNTNLNTTSLAGMKRIAGFLADSYVEYPRRVILKGDNRAKEKALYVLE